MTDRATDSQKAPIRSNPSIFLYCGVWLSSVVNGLINLLLIDLSIMTLITPLNLSARLSKGLRALIDLSVGFCNTFNFALSAPGLISQLKLKDILSPRLLINLATSTLMFAVGWFTLESNKLSLIKLFPAFSSYYFFYKVLFSTALSISCFLFISVSSSTDSESSKHASSRVLYKQFLSTITSPGRLLRFVAAFTHSLVISNTFIPALQVLLGPVLPIFWLNAAITCILGIFVYSQTSLYTQKIGELLMSQKQDKLRDTPLQSFLGLIFVSLNALGNAFFIHAPLPSSLRKTAANLILNLLRVNAFAMSYAVNITGLRGWIKVLKPENQSLRHSTWPSKPDQHNRVFSASNRTLLCLLLSLGLIFSIPFVHSTLSIVAFAYFTYACIATASDTVCYHHYKAFTNLSQELGTRVIKLRSNLSFLKSGQLARKAEKPQEPAAKTERAPNAADQAQQNETPALLSSQPL